MADTNKQQIISLSCSPKSASFLVSLQDDGGTPGGGGAGLARAQGECPCVPPTQGRPGEQLRQDQARSPGVPFLAGSVVSVLPSPLRIPLAFWRSNTLGSVDVGSGVWEKNDVLDRGEYSAICTTCLRAETPKLFLFGNARVVLFLKNAFKGIFWLLLFSKR